MGSHVSYVEALGADQLWSGGNKKELLLKMLIKLLPATHEGETAQKEFPPGHHKAHSAEALRFTCAEYEYS